MKSIRVNIMGRDYALRVSEEGEGDTRRIARLVDERMRSFKEAHPEQAELTTAVITALSLAEELHDQRTEQDHDADRVNTQLNALADTLADAIGDEPDEDDEY